MMAHDLATAGQLKALGSSLMSLKLGFDFRDFSQSILLMILAVPRACLRAGARPAGWGRDAMLPPQPYLLPSWAPE